jgi:hypothetical protein
LGIHKILDFIFVDLVLPPKITQADIDRIQSFSLYQGVLIMPGEICILIKISQK